MSSLDDFLQGIPPEHIQPIYMLPEGARFAAIEPPEMSPYILNSIDRIEGEKVNRDELDNYIDERIAALNAKMADQSAKPVSVTLFVDDTVPFFLQGAIHHADSAIWEAVSSDGRKVRVVAFVESKQDANEFAVLTPGERILCDAARRDERASIVKNLLKEAEAIEENSKGFDDYIFHKVAATRTGYIADQIKRGVL